jgi:tetratricopeptide (TPR) repeat protein
MKSLLLLFLPIFVFAQSPNLLGSCKVSDFNALPYSEWYKTGYESYVPNKIVLEDLRKIKKKNLSIKIFLGTWCADTKREFPRFLKTLELAGFKENQIEIIAVNNAPENLKQSPNHEEIGWGIYPVATFIILKKGKELNRITEFPVISLEKDLLSICTGQKYESNYSSYKIIEKWIQEGVLLDSNLSSRGLAGILKNHIKTESELNGLGYILLAKKQNFEAISVFKVNAALFPNSGNVYDSLGEAYLKDGQKENSLRFYEYALKLNPENIDAKKVIERLKK